VIIQNGGDDTAQRLQNLLHDFETRQALITGENCADAKTKATADENRRREEDHNAKLASDAQDEQRRDEQQKASDQDIKA
jgi:hypothetical protein